MQKDHVLVRTMAIRLVILKVSSGIKLFQMIILERSLKKTRLQSNILTSPAYGVYISQLIRYARACTHFTDFLIRHRFLLDRLLEQGYKKVRLIRSIKKIFLRYQPLVEKFKIELKDMVVNCFN